MIERKPDRWIKYICKACDLVIHWDSKSEKGPSECPRCHGKEITRFLENKTEVVIK